MSVGVISPEERLFVGVIVNAAQEAAGAQRVGGDSRTIQRSARAWFVNYGDDFRAVCELAGLAPLQVRQAVLAYLSRVDDDPACMVRVKRAVDPARFSHVY